MPVYRTGNNAYQIQQVGYGATGAAVNTAGFIDSSGFFTPTMPLAGDTRTTSYGILWTEENFSDVPPGEGYLTDVRLGARGSLSSASFKASSTVVTMRAGASLRGSGAKGSTTVPVERSRARLAILGAPSRIGEARAEGFGDVRIASAASTTSPATAGLAFVRVMGELRTAGAHAGASSGPFRGMASGRILSFKSGTAVATVRGEGRYVSSGLKSSANLSRPGNEAYVSIASTGAHTSSAQRLSGRSRLGTASQPTLADIAIFRSMARLSASGTKSTRSEPRINATGRYAVGSAKGSSQATPLYSLSRLATSVRKGSRDAVGIAGNLSISSNATHMGQSLSRMTATARGSNLIGFDDPRGSVAGGVGGIDYPTGGVGSGMSVHGGVGTTVGELVGGIG